MHSRIRLIKAFFWVTGADDTRFDASGPQARGWSGPQARGWQDRGGAVHKPGDGKTRVAQERPIVTAPVPPPSPPLKPRRESDTTHLGV